tara:strand:+ start:20812 stop:22155 length:1344 start_codon:yes stop_codon:yes gene_type:complete
MFRNIMLILIVVFSIFNLKAQTEISKYEIFDNLERMEKDIYEDFYKKVSFFKDEKISNKSDSLNLTYFSKNGYLFNTNNLNFVNNYFTDSLYTKENFNFLFNINNEIGTSIYQIEKEDNFIKMNLKLEEFYKGLKNKYDNNFFKEKNKKIKNKYFSNEIFIEDYTQYNFDEKYINILIGNSGNNDHRIQFFCYGDIKFAYIFSQIYYQSKVKNFLSGVQFTPIYIGLPETIKENLREYKNNKCIYTKFFKTHDEASEFLEVLKSDKSEFGMFFKINEKDSPRNLYYEATAKSFGLYNIMYEYLEPYDVLYQKDKKNEIYPIKSMFNTLLKNNYINYSDSFNLNEDFKSTVFYDTSAGFKININSKNLIAKIINKNMKAKYKIVKKDYYYELLLKEIDKVNNYNLPAKIILRKINKKYDIFIKQTLDFKVDVHSLNLGQQSVINYDKY